MKFVCTKSDLIKGINTVLKAVPSKTTMTILECILIDATTGAIKLTGNDMDLGIETIVTGMIEEKGIIAVDAKIFSEIIRKLPDSDITVKAENDKVQITCEKSKFNIAGKAGNEYPHLPTVEKKDYIEISEFSLKEVIKQTIFSISDNDNNKMMTGELFEITGDELKVVSLDGHRVSIRRVGLKESYDHKKVIVPGKTLQEISKILSDDMDKAVRIYITKNHMVFDFENTTVVSRLIEGDYFRIEQMLSSDYETKIVINKKEFLSCIDRATLLVKESDKKPIIIGITEDNMELSITSELGAMDENITISKEGRDLMIGFNPKFLIDSLRVIDDEEVTLYMVNPKAPCFIKNEEESYIYLILPVNFGGAR